MQDTKLLIYSSRDSSRLQYILQLMLYDLLGLDFEFTKDEQRFLAFNGPKLCYGLHNAGGVVFIHADELLFDTGIHPVSFHTGIYQEVTTIFNHTQKSALPFDPFAAAFYLVSRYEEYLPFGADQHDRFPAALSISYRHGFLRVPVVNHYALFLQQLLQQHFPEIIFPLKKYRFQLTYDIDMAFAYCEKGLLRNTAGLLRSVITLNLKAFTNRLKVLAGFEQDPFDTFGYQRLLHERYALQPVYFFLLGDYSRYDKNIGWKNAAFRQVVKATAESCPTGIHASYASNRLPGKLITEKERLEKITGTKVFRNRQHYLKLQMPGTYQRLLSAGITEDFTMGYASQIGFRAGIAAPFYFYDLEREATTELLIHPFAAMDATLFYHLEMDALTALQQVKLLADEVKKVNGTFIFLAHNDLISQHGPWKAWHQHFETLLSYCSAPGENIHGN